MLNDRLRRVTDLFIEGTELFFGMDEKSEPILFWVAKLNSFEVEEARRDATVKRGLRIAELIKSDSPEFLALQATIDSWSDQTLAEQRVEQQVQEIYLEVFNDIETDPDWREKVEMVRRGGSLLDDEGAPVDDPRRIEIAELQGKYIEEIRKRQSKAQLDALRDMKTNPRSTNVEDYIEEWRKRQSIEVFMTERRVTELYFALRDCRGRIQRELGEGMYEFDHSACDHTNRILAERSEVFSLPESVIERTVDALDGITVPIRESGNSDAPESSSESSEQPKTPEESTPSIPVEISPDAATT